jgi:hypothetical protein
MTASHPDVGLAAPRLVALPVQVASPATVVALVILGGIALAGGTTQSTYARATLDTSAYAAITFPRLATLAGTFRGRRLSLFSLLLLMSKPPPLGEVKLPTNGGRLAR